MSPSQRIELARGWLSPFQKDLNWFSSSAICWVQKGSAPAGKGGQFTVLRLWWKKREGEKEERMEGRKEQRREGREKEGGGQREGGTVWTLHAKSFLKCYIIPIKAQVSSYSLGLCPPS